MQAVREATAERLVRLYLAQAREQDALLGELKETAEPEDFLAARTMVGKVMGETWVEVLAPLLREWPALRLAWLET